MPDEKSVADILADWLEAREEGSAEEFEALVSRHPEHAVALREGVAAMALVDVAFERKMPVERPIPTHVGAYEVSGVLGDGGMGTVYKAVAGKGARVVPPGKVVAVKRIHEHLLRTPGFLERFHREAKAGRRVSSPSVVRTFGVESDDSTDVTRQLLVMEYVDGQTLGDLLEEMERVPEELCRHIGVEVAKGLQAIHEAQMVHRDLKPENVIITEAHEVKIMDLGVAWLADAQVRLSKSGMFLGSVLYASPEQFRGDSVDGRADLYALGLVLYELAVGQHPFAGSDTAQVIRRQLDAAPRRARDANPQLTDFLDELLDSLLQKQPDRRIRSAMELQHVLVEGERSRWWRDEARLRAQAARPALRGARVPRDTVLYGRQGELDELHGLLERAATGEGQVLLLEGEAGVGKSRLLDEFLFAVDRDVHCLVGSYPPGAVAAASDAIYDAFREHFGPTELEEGLGLYVGSVVSLVPALAKLLRQEADAESAAALAADGLTTAFTRVVRGLAQEKPTILVIEDLHFASAESRDLFRSLALAARDHAVLLIGTYRSGVPADWVQGLSRLDHVNSSTLDRLSARDLALLIQDALHAREPETELGMQIALKSDGNPYFALEMIRGMRERGLITRRPDGSWRTTGAVVEIAVPSSITDLVRRRLEELPDDERELIDVAACQGAEFDPLLTAAALGRDPIPTMRRLGRIEYRQRLVRSSGRQFVFDHHLTRETAYESLSLPLREQYHALIGRALEAAASGETPVGETAVKLAQHFFLAGQAEDALKYLGEALRFLQGEHRSQSALELIEMALAPTDLVAGGERVAILAKKFSLLDLLGRAAEKEVVVGELRSLAESVAEPEYLALCELLEGSLRIAEGRALDALDACERALNHAGAVGLKAECMKALTQKGSALRELGRYAEAAVAFREALDLADALEDEDSLTALTLSLGLICHAQEDWDQARVHFERGLELAISCGNRVWESNAVGNLATVRWEQAHYDEAEELCKRQALIAEEVGWWRGMASALGHLGAIRQKRGRQDEARVYLERHLALAREHGDRRHEAIALGNLGASFNADYDFARSKECFEGVLKIAECDSQPWIAAWAAGNLGSLYALLGQPDAGRALLEKSRTLGRELKSRKREGNVLQGLSVLEAAVDNDDEALRLVRESVRLRREISDQFGLATSLVWLGELLRRTGMQRPALEAVDEGLALMEKQSREAGVVKALAVRACLLGADSSRSIAALEAGGASCDGPEVRYLLWIATGDLDHLGRAKQHLDNLIDLAPQECRVDMLKNVRLNREIMEAWREHGGGEEQEEASDPS